MKQRNWLKLLGVAALALSLSACNSGKRQNPVGSGEETGSTTDSFESSEAKPTTYVAKAGDTLKKIAGRAEIYGDPNLWPILQDANVDKLGQGSTVNPGMELDIPRDLTSDQIDEAKEKARQAAAAGKVRASGAKKRAMPVEEQEAKVKPGKEAQPTPVPPAAVPKAKKGGMLMPVLVVLLIILAALAVILYFFMKRDNQENPQE